MSEHLSSKILKIAALKIDSPKPYERNTLILNHDGTPMDIFGASIIRALAKGLGVTFNIVIPEDNMHGSKKADGNFTGIMGILAKGAADLSFGAFTITEDRRKALPFTYPLLVTDMTFMTNKLEPQTKNSAIFDVFSCEVWIGIGLCLTLLPLLLYILLNRRKNYNTILLENIGCLLGQSCPFQVRRGSTALLLFHWFIGTTVLTASYKTVMLSILTVPKMVGIRDISDLTTAAKEHSVKCLSFKGSVDTSQWFKDDNLQIIAECLNSSYTETSSPIKAFLNYPYKKAFLACRAELNTFNRHFFTSEDSFFTSYIGFPYSKNFCCPKKLESVIHRITAAGLYEKSLGDKTFTAQLRLLKEMGILNDDTDIKPLKLTDFRGVFTVLFIGHLCSLLVFTAEILSKKFQLYCFTNGRNSMVLCHIRDI